MPGMDTRHNYPPLEEVDFHDNQPETSHGDDVVFIDARRTLTAYVTDVSWPEDDEDAVAGCLEIGQQTEGTQIDCIDHQPSQCLVRRRWPPCPLAPIPRPGAGDGFVADVVDGESNCAPCAAQPSEPFVRSIGLAVRGQTWSDMVANTRKMLSDLDADLPLSAEGAMSLMSMISWGLERWAAFMRKPLVFFPHRRTRPARRARGLGVEGGNRWRTRDNLYTADLGMGFETEDDLREEMEGRRFFAGIAIFRDGPEDTYVGLIWDDEARTLQLYDVDDRDDRRRLRISHVAQAWSAVQGGLGCQSLFGIHGMPLSPAPVFGECMKSLVMTAGAPLWKYPAGLSEGGHERWTNGYIIMDCMHKTLRGLVGMSCSELNRLVPPDERGIVGRPRARPPAFHLPHRDWRLTAMEEAGDTTEADWMDVTRVLLVLGTMACHELGMVRVEVANGDGETSVRPHRRLGLLDFSAFVGHENPISWALDAVGGETGEGFNSVEHAIAAMGQVQQFFTNLGGFQAYRLPGVRIVEGYDLNRVVGMADGLASVTTIRKSVASMLPIPPSLLWRRWDGLPLGEPCREACGQCDCGCSGLGTDRLEEPAYMATDIGLASSPATRRQLARTREAMRTHRGRVTFMTVVPPNLAGAGTWMEISQARTRAVDALARAYMARRGMTEGMT